MLLKFDIIALITSTCLLMFHAGEVKALKKPVWIESLMKYFKNNSNKHAVVILIEDTNGNQTSLIQNYTREIAQTTPSFLITFNEVNNSKSKYLTLENNPRATTMFILILVYKNESLSSRLSIPINFLNRLSKVNSRPRCLIVHLLKENPRYTYKRILQDLWTKRFLDVSVLEIVENDSRMSLGITRQEVVILHNLNPFNKLYESQKLTSKSQLFPDKTRNLYNYEVKSLLLKSSFYKEKIEMVNVMSRTMKFRSNVIAIAYNQYGESGCREEYYTAKLAEIIDNKIQFNVGPLFVSFSCSKAVFLESKIIMLGTQNAVVPRVFTPKVSIVVSWKIFCTLLFMVGLLTSVSMIPWNCKFEKKF